MPAAVLKEGIELTLRGLQMAGHRQSLLTETYTRLTAAPTLAEIGMSRAQLADDLLAISQQIPDFKDKAFQRRLLTGYAEHLRR